MKIKDINYTWVQIPLKADFHYAYLKISMCDAIIIEVETDEGITGIGHLGHHPVETFIDRNKSKLIGEDPFQTEKLYYKMKMLGAGTAWAGLAPHHATSLTAGIDCALWDIKGKTLGEPLPELLGGRWRDKIPVSTMLGWNSPDYVAKEVLRQVKEMGVKNIKFKLGCGDIGDGDPHFNIGPEPQTDYEIVKATREAVGPDILLRPDPNHTWSYATAKRMIKQMAELNPEYVENPIPGLGGVVTGPLGYALFPQLKREVAPIPICACECIGSIEDHYNVIRMGAADVIQLETYRLGALHLSKAAAQMTEAAGLGHGHHTSCIDGVQKALQVDLVASIRSFLTYMDIHAPDTDLADDIIKEKDLWEIKDGCVRVPTKPGLGVTLDRQKLEKYKVDEKTAKQWGIPRKSNWAPLY